MEVPNGKYGLQIRVPARPTSKARPPIAKPVPKLFDDEDDDSVEREIARQAAKQRTLRRVEEQHKLALEQDPNVFDYDGVYDEMKASQARPLQQNQAKRESKYIPHLIEKAKVREREHEIVYEKQLAKERAKEDHLFSDKEKFVTNAYKKKLAEQQKWIEEERLRELKEKAEEVTKRSDLSDFYRNLCGKNVAFGAESQEQRTSRSPGAKDPADKSPAESTKTAPTPGDNVEAPGPREVEARDGVASTEAVELESRSRDPEASSPSPVSKSSGGEETDQQPKQEDSQEDKRLREAAARERYLARKRLRQG